ncbi:MAG: ABC transporter permease subunit, partial [Arcanobacterium sp.]|nr:ABC transporter permease subunit [Arcanobacterium sp.]
MRHKRIIAPIILAIFFCVLWVFLTHFALVHSSILPRPETVIERLHFGISNGYLLQSLAQTTLEALSGAVLAASIGVPLGVAIAHLRLFGASVEPFIAASQAIPAIAIAPLLVTWVGYGMRAIVILCFIIVVFPIIVSTTVAIRELDRDVIDAARLDGATPMHRIWYI